MLELIPDPLENCGLFRIVYADDACVVRGNVAKTRSKFVREILGTKIGSRMNDVIKVPGCFVHYTEALRH